MQKRATAIFLIIFFTSAIGGFFIYNRWQTVPLDTGQNYVIRQTPALEESAESENYEELKSIASEIEKLTQESEDLAVKTQKFLKSSQVKGVYINEFVANSQTPFAKIYRENIKKMLEETELNGVVIDIKENSGPYLPASLKNFINELHQKDAWVIARICVFRDSSLREEKPEWYLKDSASTSSDNIWRDPSGASWLDASSTDVQQYIIDFSKKAVDFGFDELQFDYIRFPSDGKISNIIYPFYQVNTEKYEVIGGFFSKLAQELRSHDPSVILSADLFGYLATQFQALDIGQRLIDAGKYFDYLSFMLYPSHFYGGFLADYDQNRELPAVVFPYEADEVAQVVPNNPYPVILRSVLSSLDYLSSHGLSAKVRPWLQDFNLSYDVARGIIYDAEKIKAQIKGAEDAGASGFLLWNSANIYTSFR